MKIINNIFSKEIRMHKNKNIQHLLYNNEDTIVNIYTDGSFKYKQKNIVGYAFAIDNVDYFYVKNGYSIINKHKQKLGALYAETLAIRKAIEYSYKKNYNNICIYTDNKYIINTLNGNNKYINSILKALINSIQEYLSTYNNFKLNIKYIQGHSQNMGNELVNFFAQKARNRILLEKKIFPSEIININKKIVNERRY